MLTNKQLIDLAKSEAKRAKHLSDEELKKEFIDSFGEEKWAEEEMIGKMISLSMDVSNDLGVEFLPIVFEEMAEDSRIYFKEEYIGINNKFKDNYVECAKCVIHELRHIFQILYAKIFDDDRAKRFKYEFANAKELDVNNQESINEYSFQEIEIDAYAYTKWYMKKHLDIDIIHPSKDYEQIISLYMEKYF